MTLTGCTVSGNSGNYGGGLHNAGTVSLTACTVSGNSASRGAGLYNRGPFNGQATATATLTACTVSGNSASGGGGLGSGGSGLWNGPGSSLALIICTVSGNSAPANLGNVGSGGGLFNDGSLTLTACTVGGNSAKYGGGLDNFGPATLTDTIVAGNTDHAFHANDIAGNRSVTGSYNLIGPGGAGGLTNGSNGNIVLTSLTGLGLAPLGFYGGPTQTMALLPGSAAIGEGIAVGGVTTDQRGEPLDSPNPDIGAFQSQGFTLTPAPGSTPQATTVGTAFANPLTVTITANNSIEPIPGGVITFTVPSQGASATLSATTATIDASGVAQVNATANSVGGSYTVTASAATSGGPANFVLTNIAQPVFSALAGPTITYGTPSVTLSGTILAGSTAPPGSVSITVGGVTQLAAIQTNGNFSSAFSTTNLGVVGSPYVITYAYAATVGFLSATDTSQTLAVTPATPTITWPNPADITYGTALGSTQLDAATNVPGTFTYTPAAGTLLPAGAGQTLSVTFTPTDTVDYKTATATAKINVGKATPTITWGNPSDVVYGMALSGTQLDAIASVPGTFTYTPAAGTILVAGSNQALGVGFTPTDTTDYTTASFNAHVNVLMAQPLFSRLTASQSITYGQATINLSGQLAAPTAIPTGGHVSIVIGSASGQATIQSDGSFSATINTNMVRASSTPYTVSYSYAGDVNFQSASDDSTMLTINQATPSLTWHDPADIVYGTALSITQLDATASVPGTFIYTPAAGTVLGAGNHQLLAVSFTPADSTDYATASATAHINVSMAQPSFSQLTASQSISFGQSTDVSGKLAATSAIPTSEQVSIAIGSASIMAVIQPGGSFSARIETNALGASSTPYTITYSFAGDADFQSASDTSTTLTVNKATPTLNWPNPADIAYGTPLTGTQLDATTSVAGSFTYTPAAGTVLKAGAGQTLSVSFTPTDTADYKSTSDSATIRVLPATPTIAWPNPADIVYGTALSGTQLDATASVPGTFTYTPDTGTILHAGAGQTLSVGFTPTDTTDYTTTTATAMITVAQAPVTLIVSALGGTYDGAPFPAAVQIVSGASGGKNSPTSSLENTTPILTYYDGAGSWGFTPPTTTGTYTVVARFPGSTDYVAVDSAPVTFTINRGTPQIALTTSGNSAVYGQPVTIVATVNAPGTPSGTVTFSDGATPLATVPLDSSGKAMFTTTGLHIGSQSITATYSGDSRFLSVISGPASESITKATTQVVLVPHAVFKKKREVAIGLTAEIEPVAPGGGVPTGVVTFELLVKHGKKIKANLLGTSSLNRGQASLTLNPKQVMKKTITIIYNGDPDFQSTTAAIALT
jgi:hypothetical protein